MYYNNGAGSFSGPRYVNLPVTCCIALGDVNGDGIPDLVSNTGYVAFGTASGVFKKAVSYPIDAALGSENVVLADLRNDGLTDIVFDSQGSISVLLNQGKAGVEDGLWTSVTDGAGCGASADFNLDGKPDLAVNNTLGVSILLGTGKASAPFTTGTTIALPNAACLITGDLNGDGIPDLLVPANGTVNAYLGNGDGTFDLKSTVATPSGGYVALGDFNHDGKLDFATSGNLLALGKGDGTFQAPVPFVPNPPVSGFSAIATGDINNDGWTDMVLTNDSVPIVNLTVLLNNQQGGFTQAPTNFGGETYQVILADLNKDGNLDLVLGGGAAIYFGNGQGG
ncbi:MAG TPA: VCBS repeat-containing protein, partial [Desulfobaccales bacterium]